MERFRLRTRLILLTASLLVLATAFPAFGGERLYAFEQSRLANGLRVVSLEDFSTPIVAVQVWYHVGSKNEQLSRRGFAHMFEHMMFRGTKLVGPEEHFALLRRIGGDCNAFTSFDYTAYVNTVPSNQVALPLWLEADRMMFLNISQENFDTERNVVKEELRQDFNEPYGSVFMQCLPKVVSSPEYQWPPIGNLAGLEAAGSDELRAFWDRYYVPSNAVLVVCGAVKHKQARALAERYFGWLPALPEPQRPTIAEPETAKTPEVTIEERLGPVPMVGYLFRGVPENHPDDIALTVLMSILGNGDSSRLYADLVQKRRLATRVLAEAYTQEKMGFIGAGAALLPGVDPQAALQAIDDHIKTIIETPVPEAELAKAKNQLRRDLITQTLTVEGKANVLGRTAALFGDPDIANRLLEDVDRVTVGDVQRVAKAYFKPEARTVLRIMPNPDMPPLDPTKLGVETAAQNEAVIASDQKAKIERPADQPTTPPQEQLLRGLPKAKLTTKRLDNGLTVVVAQNREVPFTTMMLGLRYGASTEDPAAPGTAATALAMLTRGTERYTAAQLAEVLESNALTLDGAADLDVASVSASALADKLPLAMELMAEAVLRPTFPEDEFQLLQRQRAMGLSVKEQDPSYLAERQLRRVIFAGTPYERSAQGELEDVSKVTTQGLAKWWKTYARPDAAVLYVAGDVEPEQAVALARAQFGGWKADAPAPAVAKPTIPAAQPTHIYLIDAPGAVQSQIRVGAPTITRGHPDYHLSRVFTQIYGGSMTSRLSTFVRVKQGLTYGAAGGVVPRRFAGTFWTSTFTKSTSTGETVKALLEVIDSMKDTPPTAEELDSAKSYLVGSFPSQLETPQDFVAYQWIIDYCGLPKDYLNQAVKTYARASAPGVQRVSEEVADTGNLAIVVVGDATAILPQLEPIAPVTLIK